MGTPDPKYIRNVFSEALKGIEDDVYGKLLSQLRNQCNQLDRRQTELGLLLGVAQGTVNRYLNGKINFPVRTLVRLMLRLNLPGVTLQSDAYNAAILKGYQAAMIEVRKQQEGLSTVSIEEPQVACLLELGPEFATQPVNPEMVERVAGRVHQRYPNYSRYKPDTEELKRLVNDWGPASRVSARAILGGSDSK